MLKAWALVLAFTTIALAGCAGSEKVQDFGTVEAPHMQAGYAYAYDIWGNIESEATGTVDGEPIPVESDNVVLPRMHLLTEQILNTSFGPNGSYYLGAARFTDAPAGAMLGIDAGMIAGKAPFAIRKADLAPFTVETTQAQQCDPGCRLATTSMEVAGETPLDPYLEFPLVAGKTWQNLADVGFTLNEDAVNMVIDSRVLGKETIELGNATTQAIHVEHIIRLPSTSDVSAEFVRDMEAQGAEDIVVDVAMSGRIDTFYAEAFQNVVREAQALKMDVDISFIGGGKLYEFTLRASIELAFEMTDAILEEDPELGLADVYDFFDTAQPMKQPGQPQETGAYAIRVTADQAEFNVADGDAITFTVAADPALPADDRIRYTVSDAAGKVIDSGLGDTFEVDFDDAGLYQVVVQAITSAGVVQALDSMIVAGDYEATVDLTCGNVIVSAVPGSGSCTTAAVPLKTTKGLQGATITINADNELAYGGTFRITDAAGTSVEKDAGDGDSYELADLGTLAIGPDGWSATWHRDLAILEDASVTISLDYGPETAPATETIEAPTFLGRLIQSQLGRMQQALPLF